MGNNQTNPRDQDTFVNVADKHEEKYLRISHQSMLLIQKSDNKSQAKSEKLLNPEGDLVSKSEMLSPTKEQKILRKTPVPLVGRSPKQLETIGQGQENEQQQSMQHTSLRTTQISHQMSRQVLLQVPPEVIPGMNLTDKSHAQDNVRSSNGVIRIPASLSEAYTIHMTQSSAQLGSSQTSFQFDVRGAQLGIKQGRSQRNNNDQPTIQEAEREDSEIILKDFEYPNGKRQKSIWLPPLKPSEISQDQVQSDCIGFGTFSLFGRTINIFN